MTGMGTRAFKMPWFAALGIGLLVGLPAPAVQADEPAARPAQHPADHVVLVSIDGLAAFYFDDPRAELPTLRRLAARGGRATGMETSFPSVTWPSHTSLVTGVPPGRHGVLGNNVWSRELGREFVYIGDPERTQPQAVRAPTLYDAVHASGRTAAGIIWPCTSDAASLRWIMPDAGRRDLIERFTTPGLVAELATAGIDISRLAEWGWSKEHGPQRDALSTDVAIHLLERHGPALVLLHIIHVDGVQHAHGPRSPEAYIALAEVDRLLAKLETAIASPPLAGRATLVVVSDHGFAPVRRVIRPNVELHRLGLVDLDEPPAAPAAAGAAAAPKPTARRAWAVAQGGGCFVSILDEATLAELPTIAAALGSLEGVERVIMPDEFAALGLADPAENPEAAHLVLAAKPGWAFVGDVTGEVVGDGRDAYRGTHGHLPHHDFMHATFVAAGAGIRPATELGTIRNVDVAPTVARLLGVPLPTASGRVLEEILDAAPTATAGEPPAATPEPAPRTEPAAAAPVPTRPPNIVIVLADDLGYGDPACYNPAGRIPTPVLDRLAAEGMRFTDAHTTSSVCTPTRYGLLTGRYNWRSRLQRGVLGGLSPRLIEPGRATVASLLRHEGYHTACIGKWHLGMDWAVRPGQSVSPLSIETREQVFAVDYEQPICNGPERVGFDHFWGIAASLDMVPYTFIADDRVVAAPTEDRDFPLVADAESGRCRAGPAAPGFEAERVLPELVAKSVDYIAARAPIARAGRPFFLYVPLTAPHTPILPTPEWRHRSGLNAYADFVMQTDAAIGAILAALDEHGLANDTLVIVTSDNGCSPLADLPALARAGHDPGGGLRGHKADIYEGGHRVPFLVRWPGRVPPGTTTDHLTSTVDILATCAEAAGIALPPDAGEDSVSFLPTLAGAAEPPRTSLVMHSIDGSFAVREGRWKLCLCPGSGGWSPPRPGRDDAGLPRVQLFDLEADRGETTNLEAEHPDLVARLTALLEGWVAEGRSTPGPRRENTVPVTIHRGPAGS